MTLQLPLKAVWYDMIRSCEKREEYREITRHWIQRLVVGGPMRVYGCKMSLFAAGWYSDHLDALKEELACGKLAFAPFTDVHFTRGYPSRDDAERNMTLPLQKIVIGTGRPKWGAAEGKEYFVIKLKQKED